MSKYLLGFLLIAFGSLLQGQNDNIFLDKTFWKSNPSIETIEEKIEEGNSATALNSRGFDAVTNAIFANAPIETIEYLLSKEGNDINKLTHDKRTYIFWAASRGNIELVQYLIDNGARLDMRGSHQFSPLTFAAVGGQKDTKLYDLFIENGMDITSDTDENGANALLLIMPHIKDFTLVDYFTSKGLSITSVDHNGNGAFNYAAKRGNKELLPLLIEKGLPYKELNKNGGNALLLATRGSRGGYQSLDYLQYLNNLGLEANITNNDGLTPLHNFAVRNDDMATLDFFLNKGVDPNQITKEGDNALIISTRRNKIDIIKKLQSITKDINHKNKKGHSALTNGVYNTPEVVAFLIENGADVNVVDNNGNNLVYHLMKSYSAKESKSFNEKINLLREKGLDILATQSDGNTLYHLAVKESNMDLIKTIVDAGADINARNDNGMTALHLAAMNAKNMEIIDFLISLGADKSIKTDFEESVYDLAMENEIFTKKGIDISSLKI